MNKIRVVDHPLVAARLTVLRDKLTQPDVFRRTLQEISIFLFVEACREWQTTTIEIETPLRPCSGSILSKPVVLVPILRAGLGMLDGILRVLPDASVGHIGLYRDPETLRPVSYYSRVPTNLAAAAVVLLDPMLATGHTACAAAADLKAQGAQSISFISVIACPAGVQEFQSAHPDIPVTTAAIDPELNDHGYIVPGLGDAGDRYFGTD